MEPKRTRFLIASGLFLAVIAVYFPVSGFEFINYDDPDYVSQNWIVQQGLTWKGIVWAFEGQHAANWHPLTWISHMLDCKLFDVAPGAHHLVNVILHGVTSALLFVLVLRWTNALWRSAVVAALYALHPLRVESVAWIAERKDMLSAMFFVLTLLAYTEYVARKSATPQKQNAAGMYALCIGLFVCGLLSKPILVTVPFVLLLIDYWPLQRAQSMRSLGVLITEKLPFFVFSAGACVVTFLAQKGGDAIHNLPLLQRLAKVPVAYGTYIQKLLWPASHAVLYENSPSQWPLLAVLVWSLLIVAITAAVAMQRERRYLVVGWLWFVGMLVPVIGIIQVGENFIAERHTLLPSIGFFLALTWGVADLGTSIFGRERRTALTLTAIIAVSSCVALTAGQLPHWKNSGVLWEQTLAVEPQCVTAHNDYGLFVMESGGDMSEAAQHFNAALRTEPKDFRAWNNLGQVYLKQTNVTQAIVCFENSLRYKPDYSFALVNLGDALRHARRHKEAIPILEKASQIAPDQTPPHLILAGVYDDLGRFAEAVPHYQTALAIHPDSASAHCNLAIDLVGLGKANEAMRHFEAAIALEPENARMHYYYAWALARTGKFNEATEEYRTAMKLDDQSPDALGDLAWLLATCPDGRVRNGAEAVGFAQRACELTRFSNPRYLTSLDAAWAEAGQFTEAIATAEKAQAMFVSSGATNLAQQCASRIELYRAGKAFRLGQ